MRLNDIVSKDPDVHSGDLVFAGTRVPASHLVNHLKNNYTLDAFLEGFPSVSRERAEAFLEMTLQLAEDEIKKQQTVQDAPLD